MGELETCRVSRLIFFMKISVLIFIKNKNNWKNGNNNYSINVVLFSYFVSYEWLYVVGL